MAAIEFFKTNFYNLANLKAYYRFEGNSTDIKGGNNGTDTNITYSAGNGKFNQGAGFNGSTSVIKIPTVANLKPTGAYTIGAWVKLTSTTTYDCIFSVYSNYSSSIAGLRLFKVDTHKFNLEIRPTYTTITGGTTIDDNTWHFVVATDDTTNLNLYVDGASDASPVARNAPAYNAITNVRVGCNSNLADGSDVGSPITGAVDDLFFINGTALTLAQVQALYNGTSHRSSGWAAFL